MIQANYRILGPQKQYKKMRNAAICIQSLAWEIHPGTSCIIGVLASKYKDDMKAFKKPW